MSKKPIFPKVIIILTVALICLVLTLSLAFLFGSINTEVFDFSNLNFSNMLPIIIIGGFVSCVIIGFLIIFLAKDVFVKVKDYFFETKNDGGKEK